MFRNLEFSFKIQKKGYRKMVQVWRLKEFLRTFKDCLDVDDAHAFLCKSCVSVVQSRPDAVEKETHTFMAHPGGIFTPLKYGSCNSLTEGTNDRMRLFMQESGGYRGRECSETDILVYLG